ncbi:nuclear transport factor 2 family protein [Streptomyces beihaiensis]|uniref:Nuclear transport factor 2 family protein n=1 Tax=Streptomyces beihaiensis TaxID=2984495 RepID=A0ABT3TWF3_9ACTN|nr:nuclear transport factor 2 family protein [Streptomyces beihaiensis]MCX3060313.1 nuclear transport factor 2 family protein [Streptomyces beihaiensis]
MDAKSRVVAGVLALTGGDTDSALDTYYAPAFVQHSPMCADGRDGLRELTEKAKSVGARYDLLRSIGEGDMVLLHARVTGLAPVPLILFNLYRFADGRVAEHWEAVAPETGPTACGHDMGDGPSEITDRDRTAANKDTIRRLVQDVLIDGEPAALDEFFDGDHLIRHAPSAADGTASLRESLASVQYLTLHRTVAEGNFVFAQSEGVRDGRPHVFADLFRLADGKVVEHWDVRTEIPEQMPHDNGIV